MIKNRCLRLFLILVLSNKSVCPSDKQTVYKFPAQKEIQPQKSIAQLAQEIEPFNSIKMQNYEWRVPHDHEYTKPIKHMALAVALGQLQEHPHNKTPLSSIVSDQDALSIKEGFLNVLYNSRCDADEQVKRGYDFMNGAGKFFERYGNYKKSAQFNPAHNFATKVWPHFDNNSVAITDLVTMSENSIEETGANWLRVKSEIEFNSRRQFTKPTDK